jgi:hypothetical protein
MAKESVVKKVVKFAANEMLGVDDAKRAVSKARKGDIKGAIKSAATGALELGTTVSGAGLGAKLGAKAGLKAGKAVAESAAKRSASYAEKRTLETHPTPKLGKPGGEIKSVKTSSDTSAYVYKQGHNPVTKPRVEVTEPKKVVYKSKENSFDQRVGVQKAQEKAREKAGIDSRISAYEASRATSKAPAGGKATGKVAGAAAGTAAVAATKRTEKSTQSGNVRHRDYTKKSK